MPYTIDEIKRIALPIAKEYGVRSLRLFGSYAKGTARADSDVDILIEKGAPLSLVGLSGMRLKMEEALRCPVDLVTTTSSDGEFLDEIGGTEVVLYEAH